jgi:hypothetical protein
MSVIVHSHAEHVEKKRRVLRGNTMSCRHRPMVGAMATPPPPPDCNPEEDSCSEVESEGADHSYLSPEVFALTWHDDVGHIMHMVPCFAYFRHHICHLLSLDMFCNATCLVSISHM